MSGVAVIWYLVKSSAGVIAVVPAARIMAGGLPLNTPMPAIAVTQISSVPENQHLKRDETPKAHVDRVQVTVFRKNSPDDAGYPGLKPLLDLVLAACPSQRGTVNGVAVQGITPDLEGPDIAIPALALVTRSRDFLVRWTA